MFDVGLGFLISQKNIYFGTNNVCLIENKKVFFFLVFLSIDIVDIWGRFKCYLIFCETFVQKSLSIWSVIFEKFKLYNFLTKCAFKLIFHLGQLDKYHLKRHIKRSRNMKQRLNTMVFQLLSIFTIFGKVEAMKTTKKELL